MLALALCAASVMAGTEVALPGAAAPLKMRAAAAHFFLDEGPCAGEGKILNKDKEGCSKAALFWVEDISRQKGALASDHLRFACKGETLYMTRCDADCRKCHGWRLLEGVTPGQCLGSSIRFRCPRPEDESALTEHATAATKPGATALGDYNALLDLYRDTGGRKWELSGPGSDWLRGDPCDDGWTGVLCDEGDEAGADRRVTGLQLLASHLNGTLPASFGDLGGLTNLMFAWNAELTGKLPPDVFRHMPALASVQIDGTGFRGALPDVGGLASLRKFTASRSKMQYRLAAFQTCRALETLTLSHVQSLGGGLADLPPSVVSLDIGHNALQGFSLAGIGALPALESLDIDDVRAEGRLPAQAFAEAKALTSLKANKNYLSGPIPASLGASGTLRHLELADNLLEGVVPRFAAAETVLLRGNYLTVQQDGDGDGGGGAAAAAAAAPSSFDWFGATFGESVKRIDLSDNPLRTTLPPKLGSGAASKLESFTCHHCTLRGPLPVSYPPQLRTLQLHSNELEGPLPDALPALEHLVFLDLDQNEIEGEMPATWGKFAGPLAELRLRANRLRGPLPAGLFNLGFISRVMLDDNELEGELGAELLATESESGGGAGGAPPPGKMLFDLISAHGNKFSAVSPRLLALMHVTPPGLRLQVPGRDVRAEDEVAVTAVVPAEYVENERKGNLVLTENAPLLAAAEARYEDAKHLGLPPHYCYSAAETHNKLYDDILKSAGHSALEPNCDAGVAHSISYKTQDDRARLSFQRGLWYPRTSCLYDKGEFSLNMELGRKVFPREFTFYPPTFRLPYQIAEFRTEFRRQGDEALWLLKPMLSCCGKGIRLVKPESLTEEVVNDVDEHGGWFAMQFVSPPYLVDQQKFVIRVYTVLSSFAPLRLSIYDEPMLFWTGYDEGAGALPYSSADPKQKDRYITNWFFNNVTATLPLTMTQLAPRLRANGDDPELLWSRVRSAVVRTMLGVQTRMSRNARAYTYPGSTYECYIYDIVVTDKLEPKVCEVNVDANLAREVNYLRETSPTYPDKLDPAYLGDKVELEDDLFKKNLNADILRLHGVLPPLRRAEQDAVAARVEAAIAGAALDCSAAQREDAGRARILPTDPLHPCLSRSDRAYLATLELHSDRHEGGAGPANATAGESKLTRFEHSFPCRECTQHLHLMPELHRQDLVGVWWMNQPTSKDGGGFGGGGGGGGGSEGKAEPFAAWAQRTYPQVLARRINTKVVEE